MIVPLFPLPDAVLFPKTPMPLYVFEEKYRTMIREVIEGNKQLVIALLRPGLELNHAGLPAVYRVACLAKVESYEELEDGKYNILLVGIHRVRFVREVPHSPYRLVEVEKLEETAYDEYSTEIIRRHNRLGSLFARFTELALGAREQAREFMPQLDFESLVNMVAMTLNLPVEQKQALLETSGASQRCDLLIPVLQQQLETLVLVRKFEHIKPENPHLN